MDGKRIELHPGLTGGHLSVDGAMQEQKLPNRNGEVDLEGFGDNFVLRRKSGFAGATIELVRGGVVIPNTTTHLPLRRAPSGALCAAHPAAAAAIACTRCGTFRCVPCVAADGMRCQPCFEKADAEARKNAAAMVYMAPAFVFIVGFGAIGGLIGGLAGAGAVAFARTNQPKVAKVGVAALIYGAAGILTLVVAAAVHQAMH